MRRRVVLAGMGATSLWVTGCVSDPRPAQPTTLSPVENPPEWLIADESNCSRVEPRAVLRIEQDLVRSVSEREPVVPFSAFGPESQTIIRFAATHGKAMACRNAKYFYQFSGTFAEQGFDPYFDEHGEKPDSVYVEVENGYLQILSFRLDDMVYFYRIG